MNAQDFANLGLDYYDIMQYSTQTSRNIYSFANPTTELQSFFARAIVNYNDRFLVTEQSERMVLPSLVRIISMVISFCRCCGIYHGKILWQIILLQAI